MQMNLPFKPLMIAALMASAFTLSSQVMAGATLMDVTIDGDHLGKDKLVPLSKLVRMNRIMF